MSQTYQLSKSGIERLERFKRDVLAGDFEVREDNYPDGSLCCFTVENEDSVTCCFVRDKSDIADDLEMQFENTIRGEVEKNEYGYIVSGGIPLSRIDITIPLNVLAVVL